jgi:hypothetical protein
VLALNRPGGNSFGHLFCEEQIDQDGWDGNDRHNSELSTVIGRIFTGEFHNGERNGLEILRGEEGVRHNELIPGAYEIKHTDGSKCGFRNGQDDAEDHRRSEKAAPPKS